MTGKERIKRAIEFKGPDRVPQSTKDVFPLFILPLKSWQPEEPYYPYVHPLAVKARLWKWKGHRPKEWLNLTRTAIDEWGTIWKASPVSSLGEVIKGPLEDGWHLFDSYRAPDFSDWSRYKLFARLSKVLGKNRYLLAVDENSIWERYRFLRGFENALMDLINFPEEVHRLLDMITKVKLCSVEVFGKIGADGFMLVDDWGTQLDSFISPRHFREFFMKPYRLVVDRCHALGMHCGIHSCGQIRHIIPLFIELGMDFVELDSPCMTGIDWLAQNVAGKICLCNSADIQTIYPTGDEAEITRHLKEQILRFGNFNGGFVYWPYTEPNVIGVDSKTVKFASSVITRHGKYPLDLATLGS